MIVLFSFSSCICIQTFFLSQVMATINNMKKENALILLADGTTIGTSQNSLKYRDLSGSIGEMMKSLVSYFVSKFDFLK